MKIRVFSALFALALLASCQNNTSQGKDYKGLADGLCACLEPMAEFQKTLEDALKAPENEEEFQSMMTEMESIMAEGQNCIKALEEKYGVVEGEEDFAKAEAAFREACPEIAAFLSQGQEEAPVPVQ
ncbi:MAG: hypothetical protein D6765_01535 [Bacteroidetes bacterium]|nr:MAG: hypothetical protein D6765_01535 [Bacteroidota bacterium]